MKYQARGLVRGEQAEAAAPVEKLSSLLSTSKWIEGTCFSLEGIFQPHLTL